MYAAGAAPAGDRTWWIGVAAAAASVQAGNSCRGRVIFVLLRANSRRSVCADSGSNFTPHCPTKYIDELSPVSGSAHTYGKRNVYLFHNST